MKCQSCNDVISNEEQERVQDCFNDNYHALCFTCAEREHGVEQYIQTHSYDVETPFAENH